MCKIYRIPRANVGTILVLPLLPCFVKRQNTTCQNYGVGCCVRFCLRPFVPLARCELFTVCNFSIPSLLNTICSLHLTCIRPWRIDFRVCLSINILKFISKGVKSVTGYKNYGKDLQNPKSQTLWNDILFPPFLCLICVRSSEDFRLDSEVPEILI